MTNDLEYHFPMTGPASIRWLKDHGFTCEKEGEGFCHKLLNGKVNVGHPPHNCLQFVAVVEIEVDGEMKKHLTECRDNMLECLDEAVNWAYEVRFSK